MSHITITVYTPTGRGREILADLDEEVTERDMPLGYVSGANREWDDCRCPIHRPPQEDRDR